MSDIVQRPTPITTNTGDSRIDVTPPPVIFRRQAVATPVEKVKLRAFRANLIQCLTQIAQKDGDKPVAEIIQQRLTDFIYKYTNAHRHQKFFQVSRQVLTHLRRVNANPDVSAPVSKISEGLVKCQFCYAPTDGAVSWIAKTLLAKIQKLDILRIHCRRACLLFSAHLERGHFLNLLLSITAMLAEVAAVALKQIYGLRSAYDAIAAFVTTIDTTLPASSEAFPFHSEQIEDLSVTPKGAEIALSFATKPKSEHKFVSKGFKDDLIVEEEEKLNDAATPVRFSSKDNNGASLLQQLKLFSSQNNLKRQSEQVFVRKLKKRRR